MIHRALDRVLREAGPRIVAALAARFRDLDVAEEALAEALVRAVASWQRELPTKPDAWLYRAAERAALDILRKGEVRARLAPEAPTLEPSAEEAMLDDASLIPDERLRLIFVCCHPAVSPDSRAALTLRLVCGLQTDEIARAFMLTETALQQRLVRAKRKIAEAGVPFEIPGPELWRERLDAVLSTLEVAYSKAHEDAAGAGRHAGYAAEMLDLTRLLTGLLPEEPDVHALAALVRFAEARRPSRVDAEGYMVPLADQDPEAWHRDLIEDGQAYLRRARARASPSARSLQAMLHGAWCDRPSLAEPPPWPRILALYDALLSLRDDPVVRLNRIVAVAEVLGLEAAHAELEALDARRLGSFLPFHAVRADLLRRGGRPCEAAEAYEAALALEPAPAEAAWLRRQKSKLGFE